jgi:RecA/RadA recombinase
VTDDNWDPTNPLHCRQQDEYEALQARERTKKLDDERMGSGSMRAVDEPRSKFALEPFSDIVFHGNEEWLIKRVLPRQGVAAIYGKPGSFKSFVAADIAFCVALGRQWAGRRVAQASVVYIAAEGAAGFRKRKEGFERTNRDLPADIQFYLISGAPNLVC